MTYIFIGDRVIIDDNPNMNPDDYPEDTYIWTKGMWFTINPQIKQDNPFKVTHWWARTYDELVPRELKLKLLLLK